MTENFRGEDNYFRNAVLNCIEILKKFKSENHREIRHFYEEDVLNPDTPSFVVLVDGSSDELRTSQNLSRMQYTIHMNMAIWYYYADLTEETKRNEITYVLWEISDLLKKNVTLNGFAPHLGIEIRSVKWSPRARGNRIIAGGLINLVVKKLYSATITS